MPKALEFTVKTSPPTVIEATAADGKAYRITLNLALLNLTDLETPTPNGMPNLEFNLSVITQVTPV